MHKKAFGAPTIPLPPELLGTVGGLLAGHGTGKSLAGQTAAAIAPLGKKLRTEEKARRAAIFTGPVAGLAALAVARKYGLAQRLAKALAKKAPKGLVASPELERKAVELATPFVTGFGATTLGGIATGAVAGAISRIGAEKKPGQQTDGKAMKGSATKSAALKPLMVKQALPRHIANLVPTWAKGAIPEASHGVTQRVVQHHAGRLAARDIARLRAWGRRGAERGGMLGGVQQRLAGGLESVIRETTKKLASDESMTKAAALKLSLDILHEHFQTPMSKHAALNSLYEKQKPGLDAEALTPEFCKLAAQSGLEPWRMAYLAVRSYQDFEKLASHSNGVYRELGQFYLNWADEMVKRASLLTGISNVAQTGARAVRSGAKALGSRLQTSKGLAEKGIIKSELPTTGQAVRQSLGESRALIAEGGGSLSRGRQMIRQHGPATAPAATAPAVTAAPEATAQGMGLGKKLLIGTGLTGAGVGGTALGMNAMLGGGQAPRRPPHPHYQPAY